MCMACNKNRTATSGGTKIKTYSQKPARNRIIAGASPYGAPKVRMSFAKRGG